MPVTLGTDTYPVFLDLTDQVKPWLRIDATDFSHDFVLNTIIDSVCTRMSKFIGGPIAEKTYGPPDAIGKFDGAAGNNGAYIMLPRVPVIEVETVVEYQGSNQITLSEVSPGSGLDGFQVDYRTGLLTRIVGGVWTRPWYPGSQNVWVTWTAGYNPIPGDIIEAALDWVTNRFRNSQDRFNTSGLGLSTESEPVETAPGVWNGMPYSVRGVLGPYVKYGIY
jgi:hypothetical protein